MSLPEHTLIGFDGSSTDDVIVMHRGADGTWVIENDMVPANAADIARQVAEMYSRTRDRQPPQSLAKQVTDWLAEHAGDIDLSPWQQTVLEKIFEPGWNAATPGYTSALSRGRVHGFSEHAADLLQHLAPGKD